MLVRRAELSGRLQDVRIRDQRIAQIAKSLEPESNEETLDAAGGALLPGLQDHHLHLHSLAAALASIDCGPAKCPDAAAFAQAITTAPPDRGWIRGAGYFESVAGPLDRDRLDALRADIPIRIQHRSGAMWFVNSRALGALGLDGGPGDPGADARTGELEPDQIERDDRGRATGRLFRADRWLRDRLPNRDAPDLTPVGRLLASYGVTTVTDATPTNGAEEAALFRRAQATGALPLNLRMMGELADPERALQTAFPPTDPTFELDAHKILLDEPALPDLDGLIATIRSAHDRERPVAIHTVTRAEIHFALAALDATGGRAGDRLEHASVAPPEAVDSIRRLGLTVVTQPNFVAERGDHYRSEVAARDQPYLYRVQSWLDAGVRLGSGTDAPFGDPDPWKAMRAAVERRTPGGEVLGAAERVSPEIAFGLFQSLRARPDEGGGAGREARGEVPTIAVGDPADCCVLDRPWHEARKALSSDHVVATFRGGKCIHPV